MNLVGPSRVLEASSESDWVSVLFGSWAVQKHKAQVNLYSKLEQAIPRLKPTCFQGLLLLEEMLSDGFPPEALSSTSSVLPFANEGLQTWWDVGSLWLLLKGDGNFLSEVCVKIKSRAWLPAVCPYCSKDRLCTWQPSAIPFASAAHPFSWDVLPGWPDFQTFRITQRQLLERKAK